MNMMKGVIRSGRIDVGDGVSVGIDRAAGASEKLARGPGRSSSVSARST